MLIIGTIHSVIPLNILTALLEFRRIRFSGKMGGASGPNIGGVHVVDGHELQWMAHSLGKCIGVFEQELHSFASILSLLQIVL